MKWALLDRFGRTHSRRAKSASHGAIACRPFFSLRNSEIALSRHLEPFAHLQECNRSANVRLVAAGVRTQFAAPGKRAMKSSGKASGTYVTRAAGKGSHVVRTIVTPAGSFRTISKDVLDRAKRSANSALSGTESRIIGPRLSGRGR